MIATHSVGSLVEEYKPRDFILLDQVIDRTQKRNLTYYDNKDTSFKGVYHASFGDPYDTKLRQVCLRSFFRLQSCDTNAYPPRSYEVWNEFSDSAFLYYHS